MKSLSKGIYCLLSRVMLITHTNGPYIYVLYQHEQLMSSHTMHILYILASVQYALMNYELMHYASFCGYSVLLNIH